MKSVAARGLCNRQGWQSAFFVGEEFNPEGKIIGIPVKQRSVSDSTQGGKLYPGKVSKVPQEHILASFVGDRSVDWLRNYKGDKPFFLWVSFRSTIRRGRNGITSEMQPQRVLNLAPVVDLGRDLPELCAGHGQIRVAGHDAVGEVIAFET